MKITLDSGSARIIGRLHENGYKAYAVGGCVRDCLMGKIPHDWDICTDARPEQTEAVFSDWRVIETGLRHGTVTVVTNGTPYEITTFRTESGYSDHRKPDTVSFADDFSEDASRRDFTINAMAYNEDEGLIDPYGGAEDIRRKIIRCVGNPDERFGEDALRIMRALRFSAVLGFSIEPQTAAAADRNRSLLDYISRERIAAELLRLLCGKNVGSVLREHRSIIAAVIPEIEAEFGFCQNNIYHDSDVWEHTVRSVEAAEPDTVIRLTMLLHDIGKPCCYFENETGGHFYGHGKAGASMAREILKRLRLSNDIIDTVTELIAIHDPPLNPTKKGVLRMLNKIGGDNYRRLIAVHRADMAAHSEYARTHDGGIIDAAEETLREIEREGSCFSLKDLAVNGNDIIAAGVEEGKEVGTVLKTLMDMVISAELPNERESLMAAACAAAEKSRAEK